MPSPAPTTQVPLEIERKFLLSAAPPRMDKSSGTRIRQGYLCNTGQKSVRLRDKGGCFYLTCKAGIGIVRQEAETKITAAQFESLWPMTQGARLVKTRYLHPVGEWTAEIDLFEDSLAPLMLVEVEFTNQQAAEAFTPPAYFGRDVTQDARYLNASLCVNGLPND